MEQVDWNQVGTLGGITLLLISLFTWVLKKVLTWSMSIAMTQMAKMRDDVYAMTQSYQKANNDFIDYLKTEAQFRNKTWGDITTALRGLTEEIRELRQGRKNGSDL